MVKDQKLENNQAFSTWNIHATVHSASLTSNNPAALEPLKVEAVE